MAWVGALIGGVVQLGSGLAAGNGGGPSAEANQLMRDQSALIRSNAARADELWDINKRTYIPRERQFLIDAFDKAESEDDAVGRATADVRSISDARNKAGLRDARRLGVDPSSGAYAAQANNRALGDVGLEVATRNNSRRATRDTNFQRQYTALSLGRGLPAQTAALNSSAMAGNASLLNTQIGLDGMRADFDAARGAAIGQGAAQIGTGLADFYRSRQQQPKDQQTKAA